MRKQTKRGFTIVELVIVIAVVAILAAVLIPTFANIIKKANTAADVQTVRTLNTIIATETAINGGELSAHEAIVVVSENGYNLERITPTAEGRTIVWDGANYRFALLDDELNEVYPKDNKSGTVTQNLFVVSDTYPAAEKYANYAVYLTDAYTGAASLTVTTGIDVGYNDDITMITYNGAEAVAVRGGEHTTIQVNSGTVHHYDVAWTAYVANGATYVEHGTLASAVKEGEYEDKGFAGGTGTQEDPFLIVSGEQFALLEENSNKIYHYKLLSDIEYNGQCITSLNGTLDGNGNSLTLGSSYDSQGWPGLFAYAQRDAVIKDLEFINTDKCYCLVVYDNTTSMTFENVVASGADPDKYYATSNKNGAFLYQSSGGDLTFKNCVNNINIECTYDRVGIFAGMIKPVETSTASHGNKVIFDGCVNNANVKVSGFVGFFDAYGGSTAIAPKLVNSANAAYLTDTYTYYADDMCIECFKAGATSGTVAHAGSCHPNWNNGAMDELVGGQFIPGNPASGVTTEIYYTACYINNCANNGVIIGVTSSSEKYDAYPFCMSTGDAHHNIPRRIAGAALTTSQFEPGVMICQNTEIVFNAVTNNVVSFKPDTSGKVDKYVFTVELNFQITEIEGTRNGNRPFVITYELSADEAATFTHKHVTKVVFETDSDEYAAAYANGTEVVYDKYISYVVVDQADGSIMVIAKITDDEYAYTCADSVRYTVYGYDASGLPVAHGTRYHSDFVAW